MEEQEPDIPVLSSVIKTAGLTCTVEQLSQAELKLLKAWEWNGALLSSTNLLPSSFPLSFCGSASNPACALVGSWSGHVQRQWPREKEREWLENGRDQPTWVFLDQTN